MTDQELYDKALEMAETMKTDLEYRQFAAFILYHLNPNDQRVWLDKEGWHTDDIWQAAILRKLRTMKMQVEWSTVLTSKLNVLANDMCGPEFNIIARHCWQRISLEGAIPSQYEGSKWDENRTREGTPEGPETRKEGTRAE